MSEYQERHSVAKLIGAPPGYVGHAEGKMGQGQLVAAVEESPICVLRLDEVEKAAPEVLQVLLQVMDDGKITGSQGKVVDFSNVILLMTSNLGAAASEELKIGFGDQTKKGETSKAIEKFFSPEFRNRLDATVEFNKLQESQMLMIVDRLVTETNQLLKSNDSSVSISITEATRDRLSKDGYEPSMGARPLKRVFEEKIKKPLSRKILFDNISNCVVTIDILDDEYAFIIQ
jgi:ATP-dependent Clp protease ATP-binding subunit ClpA